MIYSKKTVNVIMELNSCNKQIASTFLYSSGNKKHKNQNKTASQKQKDLCHNYLTGRKKFKDRPIHNSRHFNFVNLIKNKNLWVLEENQ
jgi:hypothetical protein